MFVLADHNSIASNFLMEMRDVKIQGDRMRFRTNIERIGEIMAYEISKNMSFEKCTIETPLEKFEGSKITNQPVITTVLRAGFPYYQGFLNYFDHADSGFIGAMRANEGNADDIEINLGYFACPDLKSRTLIMCDPMLATGKSLHLAYEQLVASHNTPEKLIVSAIIASKQGVEYIQKHLPMAELYIGAVDATLNDQAYIVPGLGDAGDLCFGEKM